MVSLAAAVRSGVPLAVGSAERIAVVAEGKAVIVVPVGIPVPLIT